MTDLSTRATSLIEICQYAIEESQTLQFDGPASVLELDGMSSKKGRCLLNGIGSSDGLRYIEIGTWKGSTLSAILNHPTIEAVSIDDWSEFNGPKAEFEANCALYKDSLPASFKIIEKDFRQLTSADLAIGYYDCLFYDGNHTEQHQHSAITVMSGFMANEFILIVDDYAWPEVNRGTASGNHRCWS